MGWGQKIIVPRLDKPHTCGGCPLQPSSIGFAEAEGTGSNGVICLAERLGLNEAEEGLPLRPQAAAGSVFERILKQLGMVRSQFRMLNVIACAPREAELRGQRYEFGAIAHCAVHRDPELLNFPDKGVGYKQKVILAMGDVAARTLTGLSGRGNNIDQLRGYPVETPYGLVLPTYNPAFIHRESKLFGVSKFDVQYAVNIASEGWHPPTVRYNEQPTVEEAWAFFREARNLCDREPLPIITIDIENDYGTHPDGVKWSRVTSIQFSLGKSTGIFLDFTEDFMPIIKAMCGLRAMWWAHNGWRHDWPILQSAGITFGGEIHDSFWAFHHMQPDLTTQEMGDDDHGGIGISSKAGLQYVASLYAFPRRWKSLNKLQPRYYGICDVDALQYIVPPLIAQLKAKGMWESYLLHVKRYDPILVRVTERGIPVNEARRQEVRAELVVSLAAVAEEVQGLYPQALKNIDPKKGYKVPPKEKAGKFRRTPPPPSPPFGPVDLDGDLGRGGLGDTHGWQWFDDDDKLWRTMDYRLFKGLSLTRKVKCECFTLVTHNAKGVAFKKPKKVYAPDCALCAGKKVYAQHLTEEYRWVKVLPFKPTPQQILRYMQYRRHKVPMKRGLHGGPRVVTTEHKELLKMALRYSDPLYSKIVEYRQLEKLITTYIDGWAPRPDGLVHGELLQSTATGQLASQHPNLLNRPTHHELLALKFKSMIQAPARHTFVMADFKSFHGATLAALSGDEVYYKIAVQAGDAHSFLASYMVKEPIDHTLPLGELMARLEYVKKKYKAVRNTKAKPANLGYGFGMQGPGLYERNQDSFESKEEACKLIDLLDHLFSGNKKWREAEAETSHKQGFILSNHGHIRWFHSVFSFRLLECVHCDGQPGYNYGCYFCQGKGRIWDKRSGGDVEDVYAFRPANAAHCHFREVQIALDDLGLLEKASLRLPFHDELIFLCPDEYLDEALPRVVVEMRKPITVLKHPVLCPEGLVVDVDVKLGRSWDKMTEVKIS